MTWPVWVEVAVMASLGEGKYEYDIINPEGDSPLRRSCGAMWLALNKEAVEAVAALCELGS
jgi:hypothetical protein